MTNCNKCRDIPTYAEAGTTQPLERKPCPQCQIDHNADAVRSMVRNMTTSVDVKV
jgi:hypothetical protein